jgi:hypothetical protein
VADSYFGIYAGKVETNDAGAGVLGVKVPALFPAGEALDARPALPYGVLFLPEVGTKVWVQFEGGEPTLPLWTGVQQVGDEWPDDPATPDARTLRSLTDQRVVLDDTSGSEGVALVFGGKAHAVRLTDSGVVIEHDSGHTITLGDSDVVIEHSSGNTVTLADSSVKVEHSQGSSVELTSSAATLKQGSSSVKADASGVTVSGTLVKLGPGSMPVVRMGDMGVGNLGAPVAITVVTGMTVLA